MIEDLKNKDIIIQRIQQYVHQEIVSRTENIRDYMDDDKEGNKDIIGQLKEEREHWRDIEKIIAGSPDITLYGLGGIWIIWVKK